MTLYGRNTFGESHSHVDTSECEEPFCCLPGAGKGRGRIGAPPRQTRPGEKTSVFPPVLITLMKSLVH